MLTRQWSVVSSLIGLFIIPASFIGHLGSHKAVSVGIAAKPISVNVRTAIAPLDLSKFSAGDFGDGDLAR